MAITKSGRNQSRQKTASAASAPGQQRGQGATGMSLEEMGIREVWNDNFYQEMHYLDDICDKYPVVAMDTEFPGIVARPIGDFRSSADYQYQLMRCNVHVLKVIQVGLSFFSLDGERPPGIHTWQFNFDFNLNEDMYAQDSIQLLQKSGIDFDRLRKEGINGARFAEYFLTTGLVLNKKMLWLSFHSGYDFGYMVRMLHGKPLPEKESDFFYAFRMLFPVMYDVKYLMNATKNLRGGLQEIADILQVERIGPQHQAGSDSLLTGLTFFRMKELCFDGDIDKQRYSGYLYGLSAPSPGSADSGPGGTTTADELASGGSPRGESAVPTEINLNDSMACPQEELIDEPEADNAENDQLPNEDQEAIAEPVVEGDIKDDGHSSPKPEQEAQADVEQVEADIKQAELSAE